MSRGSFSQVICALIITAFQTAGATQLPPGSIDPTFVSDEVMTDSPDLGGYALVQADNKIILFGDFNRMNNAVLNTLIRLNPDGSLDPTFDASHLFDGRNYSLGHNRIDQAVLDPYGRLLLRGFFRANDGNLLRMVRLNLDGSIDPTFNLRVDDGATLSSLVPQPDGKILAVLRSTASIFLNRVVRLNGDGTLDDTFAPVCPNIPITVARQNDGKVLAGLSTNTTDHGTHPNLLTRFNEDGSDDPSFHTDFPDPPGGWVPAVSSIRVQPDGRILVVHQHGAVMRVLPDGSLDPAFQIGQQYPGRLLLLQPDGKFWVASRVRFNPDGTRDLTLQTSALGNKSISQQSDGRLITTGEFEDAPFLVRRVSLDGELDPSFSIGGRPIRTQNGYPSNALPMPDGKVVISGTFNRVGDLTRSGLARLDQNGKVDPTFDSGDLADANYGARTLTLHPNGQLLVMFNDNVRPFVRQRDGRSRLSRTLLGDGDQHRFPS